MDQLELETENHVADATSGFKIIDEYMIWSRVKIVLTRANEAWTR